MKQLFLTISAIISFITYGQTDFFMNDEMKNENLRGKIKSVRLEKYHFQEKFGKVEKGGFVEHEQHIYDKLGYKTELRHNIEQMYMNGV